MHGQPLLFKELCSEGVWTAADDHVLDREGGRGALRVALRRFFDMSHCSPLRAFLRLRLRWRPT